MSKLIRYSLNLNTPPRATDADPDVRHGMLGQMPAGARLLPPCVPSKVIRVPKEPLIFFKPPSSLIASGDHIVYPRLSERVDFEGAVGSDRKTSAFCYSRERAPIHPRLHLRQQCDSARSAEESMDARQRV